MMNTASVPRTTRRRRNLLRGENYRLRSKSDIMRLRYVLAVLAALLQASLLSSILDPESSLSGGTALRLRRRTVGSRSRRFRPKTGKKTPTPVSSRSPSEQRPQVFFSTTTRAEATTSLNVCGNNIRSSRKFILYVSTLSFSEFTFLREYNIISTPETPFSARIMAERTEAIYTSSHILCLTTETRRR